MARRCRRHRGRGLGAGRARGVLASRRSAPRQTPSPPPDRLTSSAGGWSWWRRWLRRWRRGHFGRRAAGASSATLQAHHPAEEPDRRARPRQPTQAPRQAARSVALLQAPVAVWRRRWPVDGQPSLGAVPGKAPGVGHLSRGGQRVAVRRALHSRERQGRHRHGRLQRFGSLADAESSSSIVMRPARCTTSTSRPAAPVRRPKWRSDGSRQAGRDPASATGGTPAPSTPGSRSTGRPCSSQRLRRQLGGGTLYYVSSATASK